MRFLSSHGIAQPRGFRMAAELALNTSLRQALEAEAPDPARLAAILEEAAQRRGHAARGRAGPGRRAHARAPGRRAARQRRRTCRGSRSSRRSWTWPASCPSRWISGRCRTRYYQLLRQPAARPPARGRGGVRGRAPMGRAVPRARREALGQGERTRPAAASRRAPDPTGVSGSSGSATLHIELTPVLEKAFRVSGVPEKLLPLFALSHDLRWTWRPDVRALFEFLDPEAWQRAGGNPVQLFREVPAERLWHAAEDPTYQAELLAMVRRLTEEDLAEPRHPAARELVARGERDRLLLGRVRPDRGPADLRRRPRRARRATT